MDYTTRELLKRYAKLAIGQPFSPILLNILVTSVCDMRCTHCFFTEELDDRPRHHRVHRQIRGACSRCLHRRGIGNDRVRAPADSNPRCLVPASRTGNGSDPRRRRVRVSAAPHRPAACCRAGAFGTPHQRADGARMGADRRDRGRCCRRSS